MKVFHISASGLKNIIFASDENEDFRFVIGSEEIKIQRILAEFISPLVSHIHHSDPTIDSLSLNKFIRYEKQEDINKIITTELIENIKKISCGYSIEIDDDMINKLQFFSILIGNEEMYNEINKLYSKQSTKEKMYKNIKFLEIIDIESIEFPIFNDQFFDSISDQFESIDKNKLLKLPKSVLFSIISNDNLKTTNVDSLFDFINTIFSNTIDINDINDREYDLNLISFYEELDIEKLSEDKFEELIETINPEKITRSFWYKLKRCIIKFNKLRENDSASSKNEIKIEYDNNSNNRFKGIINYLGQGESKSAVDKGIINVTGSSTTDNLNSSQPLNAVDYQNIDSQFYTKNLPNQWLCIDFKERKVNPSHYSVRSNAWKSNWFNIQSWCIEGSNDGNAWTTLDTRNGDKSLDGSNASNTFTIPSHSKSTNFYQFLRLRQTGVNTFNKNNALILTGLEFFGTVKE